MNPASAGYRWNIVLLLAGSQAIAYIDRVFTIAGAYTPDDILAITFLTLSVASVSFSTAAVKLHPDRRGAGPHRLLAGVLAEFRRERRWVFAPLVTGTLISASGDFTVPLLVAAGVALIFGCGSYGLIVGNLDRELGTR